MTMSLTMKPSSLSSPPSLLRRRLSSSKSSDGTQPRSSRSRARRAPPPQGPRRRRRTGATGPGSGTGDRSPPQQHRSPRPVESHNTSITSGPHLWVVGKTARPRIGFLIASPLTAKRLGGDARNGRAARGRGRGAAAAVNSPLNAVSQRGLSSASVLRRLRRRPRSGGAPIGCGVRRRFDPWTWDPSWVSRSTSSVQRCVELHRARKFRVETRRRLDVDSTTSDSSESLPRQPSTACGTSSRNPTTGSGALIKAAFLTSLNAAENNASPRERAVDSQSL